MSLELRQRLFAELDALVLVDAHTHINPHQPAAQSLADILGYHYFTELAHSAGMPQGTRSNGRAGIRATGFAGWWSIWSPCRTRSSTAGCWTSPARFSDSRASRSRRQLGSLIRRVDSRRRAKRTGRSRSSGPASSKRCFSPTTSTTRSRVGTRASTFRASAPTNWCFACTTTGSGSDSKRPRTCRFPNPRQLRDALGKIFDHFAAHDVRACAISLPPDFAPTQVSEGRAATAWDNIRAEAHAWDERDQRALVATSSSGP